MIHCIRIGLLKLKKKKNNPTKSTVNLSHKILKIYDLLSYLFPI